VIIETFRSLKWADFLINALVDPRALCRQINKNEPKPFGMSFILPASFAVIDIITVSMLSTQTPFFYYKISYGWILLFIYLSFKIVFFALLMDLLAQFLGYAGSIKDTITLVNFSIFPKLFLLPVIYIFNVFNFAPLFFYMFISFGLYAWSAVIIILGISEMHKSDFGKSLLIFIFPYLFVGVIFGFIVILSSVYFFSFIFK